MNRGRKKEEEERRGERESERARAGDGADGADGTMPADPPLRSQIIRIQLKKEEEEKETTRTSAFQRTSLTDCLSRALPDTTTTDFLPYSLHLACTVQHHHGIPGAE